MRIHKAYGDLHVTYVWNHITLQGEEGEVILVGKDVLALSQDLQRWLRGEAISGVNTRENTRQKTLFGGE